MHASFDYLRIRIASPKRIKSWSERTLPNGEIVGEVLRPETINFRTHQPELYGLFCEKIFGPIKNWKCRCGKYNGFALDKICEECHVEVIEARVRRYRMGYIELTCPVTHLWYLKGVPNYLSILLRCFDEDLSVSKIEQIVYFREGTREIESKHPLYRFFYQDKNSESNELNKLLEHSSTLSITDDLILPETISPFLKTSLRKKRKGAEIIKAALENLNLPLQIKKTRSFIDSIFLADLKKTHLPDKSIIRRIRILESFLATKTNPSWMVLTTLPVLPPNLRPLVELESGRLVAADVNEIYRLIITRNQRLSDFLYRFVAPDLISIQGRKLLQEGVDSLIDNARLPKNKTFCLNNKALKSLTEILEGKQGRFRQSLLGKRVDYSGRSVIIVGPNLRLNECGLPYEMATELFQPFLINELLKTKIKPPSHNTKLAHIIIKKNKPFIWTLLEGLTRKHCILLNRAPTLHRFGIQAFNPVIILGQAIHLHPLVCTGFNADFDGDQMAVHLPLYESSQLEARTMMRPSYNVLSPSNGEVILKPTQDMVIGCYYLTLMIRNNRYKLQKWFGNETEALVAFYQKKLSIHTPILVRYSVLKFLVKIDQNELIFLNSEMFLKEKKVFLHKIFETGKRNKKYYLITNIGILIAHYKNDLTYEINDLLLETTPGRLIFSINFKNLIMMK
uniref:DNA-directed RNA polymerase subunit n=1 Tax=Ochromonas sp. CCMP1393 TaxID=420556 RepID=A0A0D3MKC2_9STRA|nr:DNA-directed RNA polymerase subunit beta' [Ochromonas sp. CCMP1393]